MGFKDDIEKGADGLFGGTYQVTKGTVVPDVGDMPFAKVGRELELAMLFVDVRESTKIVDGFRRTTAAKMYKAFLWGVAKIARHNYGELRSFNGDGVLVAFIGNSKRTNAAKAALQMVWYCRDVLRPRLESLFEKNSELQDLDFDFGIGVAVGTVLVVRAGIRGENNNDLVWVGNATNYSVKLSSLASDPHNVYISEDVYERMHESNKMGGANNENMWEKRYWTENDENVYCSNWQWSLPN